MLETRVLRDFVSLSKKIISGGLIGIFGFGIGFVGTNFSSPVPSTLTPTTKEETFVAVYSTDYTRATEKPKQVVAEVAELFDEKSPASLVTIEISSKKVEDLLVLESSVLESESVTPSPTQIVLAPTIVDTNTSGLQAEVLFSLVNAHRSSLGLPGFVRDERVCAIAQARKPELQAEVASGRMHAGLSARRYPFWVTENMISMRTEEEALQWWLYSGIHRSQLEGNYQYSCTVCSGNACAQIFTNFISKYHEALPTLTPTVTP